MFPVSGSTQVLKFERPAQERTLQPVMALLFLVALATIGDNRVGGYKQLVTRHATTTARTISTVCWNHGEVKYEFDVNGRKYTGSTYWLETPCNQVKPGYTFSVNYDPLDPTLNTTMAPNEAYIHHRDHLWSRIAVGVILIGGLLYHLLRKKIDSSKGNESETPHVS